MDLDWRLRLAAMDALRHITEPSGGVITRKQMDAGFEFEGARIRFAAPKGGPGIWRPGLNRKGGAALSILTASVKLGRAPKYDDQIASDKGWFEYKYQGTDPSAYDNVAVRRVCEFARPLIYFYGVSPGLYEAIFPAYVVDDDPSNLVFRIAASSSLMPTDLSLTSESVALFKAYTTAFVKRRLHQHRFRELVVAAYRNRCTVCRLNHPELLDAAHILEDRDERGTPEIPNGLALCKIHHGAYDVDILGISPDYVITIRPSILDEHDGPMLQHGLKEMHGSSITPPKNPIHRPNRDFLAERYKRFLAA